MPADFPPAYEAPNAAASTLQTILTQQRLDARQKLMDSIHAQDVQSQIRDRDENTATNQEYRRGLVANRQALADQRRLTDLGDQPAPIDPTSDTAKFLRVAAPTRYKETPASTTLPSTSTIGGAPLAQAPAPALGGPDSTATPPPPVPAAALATQASPSVTTPATGQYLGSSKYQSQKDTQTKMEALFNDTTLTPEQKILKAATLFPGTDPVAALEHYYTNKTQQGPTRVIYGDDVTKKVVDAATGQPPVGGLKAGESVHWIPRSAETAPTPAHPWTLGVMNDPDNAGQKIPAWINPMDPQAEPVPVKQGAGKAAPPVKPIQISPTIISRLGQLKGASTPKPGLLWNSAPNPQAVAAYESERAGAAFNAARGQSPQFQELLQNILADPGTKLGTPQEVVQHHLDNGAKLTQAEKDNMVTILQAIK